MILELILAGAFVATAASHWHLRDLFTKEKAALHTALTNLAGTVSTDITTVRSDLTKRLDLRLDAKNAVLKAEHKAALSGAYTALKSEVKSEYEAKVAKLESSIKDIAIVIKQSDKKAFADVHQRVEELSNSQ